MTSKELYSWLSGHPLINLNGLCKEVGIDRGNLIKAKNDGKELKKEVLEKFEEILLNYGMSKSYSGGITQAIEQFKNATSIQPDKNKGEIKVYDKLMAAAKLGVKDVDAFKKEVMESRLNGNQKSMIFSKIIKL